MTKSIGNYQVIRQLGEGHYGTVYLAVGEVPARGPKPPRRRIVAIKTLREDADDEDAGSASSASAATAAAAAAAAAAAPFHRGFHAPPIDLRTNR